jgi:hypothetical protein
MLRLRAEERSMRAFGWVTGFIVGILGACGFPQIEFEQNVPSDAGGQIAEETNVEAGGRPPALMAAVGVHRLGEAFPCASSNPCDCDGDGYLAKTATCGGNDCDDSDRRVHPKQDFVDEPPESGHTGDWDCSGGIEKQYVHKLDCKTLLGLECNASAQGFVDDPPCGALADYYQCAPTLLACEPSKIGQRRQACH